MIRGQVVLAGVALTGLALVVTQLSAGGGSFKDALMKYVADIKAGKGSPDAAVKASGGDLEEIMHTLKPASKGGLKAGKIETGIEKKIQSIAREGASKADVAAAADLQELAAIVEAVANVTEKVPNDKGKKKAGQWKEFSGAMIDGAKKLSAAAKAGSAADIKAAAVIINNSCNGCHSNFR
jgi:hypothetical protein